MGNFSKKIFIFLFLLLPISTFAMFIQPSYVPVDRLIANTNAFLKDNPNNQQAFYMLARIHYLAFINKATIVGVESEGTSPAHLTRVAPDWLLGEFIGSARQEQAKLLTLKELGITIEESQAVKYREKYWGVFQAKLNVLNEGNWKPEPISQEAVLAHVKEAIVNFNKAIALDKNNGLYHLGLASLYSQFLEYKKSTEIKNEPLELKELTIEKTRALFYKAYSLSIKGDLMLENKPISGLNSLVSFEAGNAYLNLTNKNSMKEDPKVSKEITENISKIGLIGVGKPQLMTPIIFTLENHNSVSELLNSSLNVNFDLDGDGKIELWPWLKNTTGLLVWDPLATGRITSGRQLFGSVTWWVFFQNGYQALDTLDDNRDGQLSGDELVGISTWFDKNSNGISEPGEIIELKALDIKSIGTKPTGETNNMPMHSSGITLFNGKKLPSYDWITSPTSLK